MTSRRTLKAAEAIREVVSMAILAELKDPRVRDVTVTFVEVSGDMRLAKVHVSVMGDEAKQRTAMAGLRNSAGFLQSKVAKRIDTRYTPKIEFYLDQGVKKSIEVARILREVLPPSETEETDGAEEAEEQLEQEAEETNAEAERHDAAEPPAEDQGQDR